MGDFNKEVQLGAYNKELQLGDYNKELQLGANNKELQLGIYDEEIQLMGLLVVQFWKLQLFVYKKKPRLVVFSLVGQVVWTCWWSKTVGPLGCPSMVDTLWSRSWWAFLGSKSG